MKKILLLLTLFLSVSSVFSQSRTNRSELRFINSSEKLYSSTGWMYNEKRGEWVDYENVISDNTDYKTKYKSLLGEWMMSRLEQNFKDIETKSLNINEKSYFVVMVKKWNGKYEYPSIQTDWYTWEEVQGFIFTEEEYSKILDFNGEIKLETRYHVHLGSKYEEYDETVFLDLIQTELNSDTRYGSIHTFPVLKTKSEETEVIRFYIPQVFTSYSNFDFEKRYFEVYPSSFEKIIIR
jgi:hypothetical protein